MYTVANSVIGSMQRSTAVIQSCSIYDRSSHYNQRNRAMTVIVAYADDIRHMRLNNIHYARRCQISGRNGVGSDLIDVRGIYLPHWHCRTPQAALRGRATICGSARRRRAYIALRVTLFAAQHNNNLQFATTPANAYGAVGIPPHNGG